MSKYNPLAWLTNQPTELDLTLNPDSTGPTPEYGLTTPPPGEYSPQYYNYKAPNTPDNFNPFRPPFGQ